MKIKTGFAFHCHHDRLVEWVCDFNERENYIKTDKPLEERPLRLKLFKLIPKNRIPPDLLKARTAYGKAAANVKVGVAYDKTWVAYEKTWAVYDKVLTSHKDYFEKLHNELCPDCPWDGE